jgi:hypothetical protein
MKTSHVTLNIGLNNNPLTATEIKERLSNSFPNNLIEFREALGEYEGHDEPTLVVKISQVPTDFDHWVVFVGVLNELMTQECIPIKLVWMNEYGIEKNKTQLVYNKDFNGEKYTFDPKYFIEM